MNLQSDTIGKLAEALAKAQGKLPTVPRDKTVKVKTRAGGEYTFSYADLEAIWGAIRQPLSEQGLSVTQLMAYQEGKPYLVTTLLHTSGEWLRSEYAIAPTENGPQAFGSAISYARRYSLTALVGVVSDEDDDGNAASGNRAQKVGKQPAPASTKPPPMLSTAKAQKLHKVFGAAGAEDHLGFASDVLGRPIQSFTDLTTAEAVEVYEALKAEDAE